MADGVSKCAHLLQFLTPQSLSFLISSSSSKASILISVPPMISKDGQTEVVILVMSQKSGVNESGGWNTVTIQESHLPLVSLLLKWYMADFTKVQLQSVEDSLFQCDIKF